MDDTAPGAATKIRAKADAPAVPLDVGRRQEDLNFSSIMGLDSAGGWHVLRLSPEGAIAADAAGLKVLQQFFPDDADWAFGMPKTFAVAFLDCRHWGLERSPKRLSASLAFVKQGVKLTVHFIPDSEGGYILLKTGNAARPVDLSAWPLTEREKEVAALVSAGKTNVEIGILLDISMRTVQKHLENIFRKLGVETRMALAARLAG